MDDGGGGEDDSTLEAAAATLLKLGCCACCAEPKSVLAELPTPEPVGGVVAAGAMAEPPRLPPVVEPPMPACSESPEPAGAPGAAVTAAMVPAVLCESSARLMLALATDTMLGVEVGGAETLKLGVEPPMAMIEPFERGESAPDNSASGCGCCCCCGCCGCCWRISSSAALSLQ